MTAKTTIETAVAGARRARHERRARARRPRTARGRSPWSAISPTAKRDRGDRARPDPCVHRRVELIQLTSSSARAKSSASNGRRSSSASPMPISLTGMPSSPAIASAMPPLAVPSSLVSTMPSTGTASENSLAWRRPFWPVVASTVSSVSCGASGSCLVDHAADLGQLGHQVVLGVQAPGGVDDHDVDAALAPARDRVEGDRARVGALGGPLTNSQPGALAPTPRAARPRRRGTCRPRRAATVWPSSRAGARRACRSSSSCRCR